MFAIRCTVPLLAGALALAGCDAPAGNGGSAAPPVDSAAVARQESETGATPGVLVPVNRSDVRGAVRLSRNGDDLLAVVDAEGLEPGVRYSVRIHEGDCADGGPVLLPLGRMTAGEDGTGSLRFRAEADRLPNAERVFVQIHTGDRAVACANVERGGVGS